jgi:penicillin-binding protein 1B
MWYLGVRGAVIALFAGVGLTAWLDLTVRAQFEGYRWALPAQIFARPLTVFPGLELSTEALRTELEIAGFQHVAKPARPGQFAVSPRRAVIHTRNFKFSDGAEAPQRLLVSWHGSRVVSISDQRGRNLALARFEPALIAKIYPADKQDRQLKALKDYPPELVAGLVMVEDRDFFQHGGISLWAVARAMFANVLAGAAVQGGSTLTQQLAKNFFLSHERTLWRKVREAIIALLLEHHYAKETILEAYMNEIHLGQHGARAIHGFGSAAQFYFGRPVGELRLHESALLLALVRGGSYYNPRRQPERARERRNLVLRIMSEQGVISAALATTAAAQALAIRQQAAPTSSRHPAFMELVRKQLREQYSDGTLKRDGLRVFTTLEPLTQRAAEQALAARLAQLEGAKKLPKQSLQGAVVVVAPTSGDVLAIVGDRDAQAFGFNRALHAQRPIGSMVKPMVFLTALEQGGYSGATIVSDAPISVRVAGGKTWRPKNYDGRSHGDVSFNDALARSLNLATVRIGLDVGVNNVVKTLTKLGMDKSVRPVPSLLLGALEMTPFQVARVYQPLASEGFRAPLRAVRDVTDTNGRTLQRFSLKFSPGASTRAVRELREGMRAVVERGTGRYAHQQLGGIRLAGKTGTTDGLRDSWFGGFDRDRLTVVWVGRDDNQPAGLTGASGALRVWTDVMRAVGVHDIQGQDRPVVASTTVAASAAPASARTSAAEGAPRAPSNAPPSAKSNDCSGDVLGGWLRSMFATDCGLEPSDDTANTGDAH